MATATGGRVLSPLPILPSNSRPSSPASPHRSRRFSHIFSSFGLFSSKSRPSTPEPTHHARAHSTSESGHAPGEETSSAASTSYGSPRSLVLTPATSPSPAPDSPQSSKPRRSVSVSRTSGIGSKIGAVLRVRSLRRRREGEGGGDEADPRRHPHLREASDGSGHIQDIEASPTSPDDPSRPPNSRNASSGGMQVVRGWKDEEERQHILKEAAAAARRSQKQPHTGAEDDVELLLPDEHSAQARRSHSQRWRSTMGSIFTEELFYEAQESFEDEDKTPVGSEKTAREADIGEDSNKNNVDRISGTGHGNNRPSDINNYDRASLHPRVESARSSAPLSSNDDIDHSANANSGGQPNLTAQTSIVDPQGTDTRASIAVSPGFPPDAVYHQSQSSSERKNRSGTAAERLSLGNAPTATLGQDGIIKVVDPLTESVISARKVQPQEDPLASTRGRTPSPSNHPARPPRRPSSTPPGSYTLDRHQDQEIEKDDSRLGLLKSMLSHQHSASASTSAGQPSSFPPYPYAHLYPQQPQPQPQPQASSSRHHQQGSRVPHSHHGHGSGFAQNIPHQYQQPPPPQQKKESPWSGTLPPATTTAAAPSGPSHASNKAQKAWWSHFNIVRAMKKETNEGYQAPDNAVPNGVVFGKPLKESLRHANVQISTADSNGELYVWGYIPVVVAKCGLYLKENATEVPGTFRVNGSTRRMRLLQEAFETPPRYGKNLDWKQENYTTHDVASVFRRYLTQMPEPVIPYDLYHQFRDTLANAANQEEAVARFKSLIRQMPRANQYLLLYVLDLLSVFARKSDVNLMTATNLAVIFRPGLISHPNHEMSPQEHALSQKVLEFLIAQQDWFMLDIPPPPQRRSTTAPQATTTPTPSHGHERQGSADQRPAHPHAPQHIQQSSTTAVHHLPLDQQPHNVSANTSAFSGPPPFAPASLPAHTTTSAPLSPSLLSPSSHPSQRPPISRFGSSSGGQRPLSGVGSEVDDVMIIPGGVLQETEEFSAGPGGGWRLVSKTDKDAGGMEKDRLKMMRRRTMERSDLQNREDALDDEDIYAGGPSSPSPTTHSHHSSSNNGLGVKRSRTLPTSRRRNDDDDSKRLATQMTAAGELVQTSVSTGSGTPLPKEKDKENSGLVKDSSRRGLLLKKGRRASHAVDKERTL